MHWTPHQSLRAIKTTKKLQLVHIDVYSPMQTRSFSGSRYFITFTNDYSHCCKVYFLKENQRQLRSSKNLKQLLRRNQTSRLYGLTEEANIYQDSIVPTWKNSIQTEFLSPHTSVEWSIKEIESNNHGSCTITSGLNKSYWAETVATADYLWNHMVTTSIKPWEKLC